MWESRRDFQRVWEGWEAGIMAFHAFHTLSFPRPALAAQMLDKRAPTFARASAHQGAENHGERDFPIRKQVVNRDLPPKASHVAHTSSAMVRLKRTALLFGIF